MKSGSPCDSPGDSPCESARDELIKELTEELAYLYDIFEKVGITPDDLPRVMEAVAKYIIANESAALARLYNVDEGIVAHLLKESNYDIEAVKQKLSKLVESNKVDEQSRYTRAYARADAGAYAGAQTSSNESAIDERLVSRYFERLRKVAEEGYPDLPT